MTRALRYEWAALRSLSTPRWLLMGAILVGALGSLLYGWLALELPAGPAELLVLVGSKPSVAPLGAAVLAVLVHGGERRYGTRTTTSLVLPRRPRQAAARAGVLAFLATLLSVLSLGAGLLVGRLVLSDRLQLTVGAGALAQWAGGHVAQTVGCVLLGLAVAEVLPGRAALVLVLAVPLLLEPMIRGTLGMFTTQAANWVNLLTPYTSGMAMSDIAPGATASVLSVANQPDPRAGALIFVGFVLLVCAPAYRRFLACDHGVAGG